MGIFISEEDNNHIGVNLNLDINLNNNNPVVINCPTCNTTFSFNNLKKKIVSLFEALLKEKEKILIKEIKDYKAEFYKFKIYLFEKDYVYSMKLIDEPDENIRKELELKREVYNDIMDYLKQKEIEMRGNNETT